MDYDKMLSIFSLSEILEASGINEAELLDLLVNEGYLEIAEYVRRTTEETFPEESYTD